MQEKLYGNVPETNTVRNRARQRPGSFVETRSLAQAVLYQIDSSRTDLDFLSKAGERSTHPISRLTENREVTSQIGFSNERALVIFQGEPLR
jgi:hypothetical protein